MKTYKLSGVTIRFGGRVVPVEVFTLRVVKVSEVDWSIGSDPKDADAIDVEGVEVLDVPALPPHEPEGGAR